MKKKMLIWPAVLMAAVVAVFPISAKGGGKADDFWQFYEQYPHLQEFFPYGMYGGMEGMSWHLGETRDSAFLRLYLDDFLENNLNITFGGGPNTAYFLKHLSNTNLVKETYPKYQWGDGYYRELLPLYEIKALPTVIEWMYHFGPKVFDKFKRPAPLLNEAEMAEIEAACKPGLDAAEYLVKNYSNAVVGIVTDDEPGDWASVIAGIELVKKRTGYPAVLCNNEINTAIYTAKHLRLVTGDLYPAPNHWKIAEDLRKFNRECPDGVFWFLPWEVADRPNPLTYKPGGVHEASGRINRSGLRLQIWESLALGCKGYFFFHGSYDFSWWSSDGDTYHAPGFSNFDALLHPHSDLLEEIRLIGNDLTTIGPLLLSCRVEQNVKIGVDCGKVGFPDFRGPALDYGLLKDIKHDRYYLIPWNNDIGREQSGTFSIPDDILKGRKIYDIQELREVDADKGQLNVTLIPGGGKIYLIAPAKEYKSCLQTIQRHKTRPERVKVQVRYAMAKTNQVDLSGADAIIAKALKAEAKEKWVSAVELYRSAYDAILSAEAGVPELGQIRAKLDAAAADLGTITDTLRVNRRQLEFPMKLGGHEAVASGLYTNKYAGKEIQQWVELWRKYFEAQDKFVAGKNREALLKDATTLADNSRSNAEAVRKITETRISELRKPFKVAFITPDYHTPDRDTMEYMQIFSDLTRDRDNYNADWFAPDGKGGLVSARGQPFQSADYKVIWIHSLRYNQPPPRGRQTRPEQALMPELMKPATIKLMKDHLEKGGGLLLTGIAGLYALPLGVETNLPDRLRESKLYGHSRFCIGLKPRPGYERHPIFNGFDTNGFYCNGNTYANNFVSECAWDERLPSGMSVAGELDVQGSEERYAAAVEYKLGKGKILITGGKSFDFTPEDGKSRFGGDKSINIGDVSMDAFMDSQWKLAMNALGYLAAENFYVPDAAAQNNSAQTADKKPALPEIQVPRIPDANGDISQIDWTKVADLGGWCAIDGTTTARKVETRVAHDGKYLYVRLIDNLNGDKLVESDEVWGGDVWEVFFSTSRHEPPYRQMAVNVKAKYAAFRYGEDEKEWDSGAKVASTANADQWQVGLAFPLARLLPDGLKPGDVFYANFYRQITSTGELLAWSPNYVKAFHELKRMGRFTL